MSEPMQLSPMLDNFTMGDVISDHNGVRCCPALEKNSDSKYIVKIISIPATDSQLEALLLSGAYSSADAASEYFKSLAEDVVGEAQILDKLSQLEGFLSYTDLQLVPMIDGTGFDIYLLSPYRKTLAQLLRQDSMTHLAALNLALDICAALTICRRSGYLYVDLKPENIYLESGKSNKIGDLGFVPLNALRFASLPDRYRSAYTPPEIADAFATLNTTIDVFALGLILYQIFNDGLLPQIANDSDSSIAPPAYADYEMAEIILKCCDPDPNNRWQDPIELGQAIVAYMQRNGAHDTPITPVVTVDTTSVSDESNENSADSIEAPTEDTDQVNVSESDCETLMDTALETETSENLPSEIENSDSAELYTEISDNNFTYLENDETAPEQQDDDIDYTEVSCEVSDILQQADELIQHHPPNPVVSPDPIDVPIPAPIQLAADESAENSQDDLNPDITSEQQDIIEDNSENEQMDEEEFQKLPRHKTHWIRNIFITVTVLAIAAISVLFYTKYYLQPIDSIILQEHENGDLTVIVSSPIDESKLNVICSDTYGNQLTKPLVDGQAEFTGLSPDAAYTVKIAIDGFHKLTGDTSAAFTTPAQTNIVQFQAVTGSEDGSVILTFTIDGPDSAQWLVKYSSADTSEQQIVFSGRMCTITGLSIGSEYKFNLTPVTNINYTGTTEVTYTASKIVKASDLRITGCLNGVLTATWKAPSDTQIDSWTVHCYNDSGYDKTLTVNDTNVSFDGVDSTSAYTVEVTAVGMSVSERAFAPANSATVTELKADITKSNAISITWNSNGFTPKNGWILLYTIDGSASEELRNITENKAEISNLVPGAEYVFSLQTADNVSVLGGESKLQTKNPKTFSGYGVSAKHMEFKMCERPSKKNWDRHDLSSSDYTSTFKAGQKASFLVRLRHEYNTSKDKITTLYVIRDENGAVVRTSSTTSTWTKMWYRSYCELDIPSMPDTAGKYTISVYFNGALAHSQSFKITT